MIGYLFLFACFRGFGLRSLGEKTELKTEPSPSSVLHLSRFEDRWEVPLRKKLSDKKGEIAEAGKPLSSQPRAARTFLRKPVGKKVREL